MYKLLGKFSSKVRYSKQALYRIRSFLLLALVVTIAELPYSVATSQSSRRQETGSAVTWQGILHAGSDLRVVVKISTAGSDPTRIDFYSIDQTGQAFAASGINAEGGQLKFTVAILDGSYEGKLSPDGKTMLGTWKQGGTAFALNLQRANTATAFEIPALPPPPKVMDPKAKPSFAVATIKPSKPDQPGMLYGFPNRRFTSINTSLADLICIAYDIQATQISGGPRWVPTDKFDLAALPEGDGDPSLPQWKGMIKKLLADRYMLVFHFEKRDLPAYVMTIARSGAKLKESQGYSNNFPGLIFEQFGVLSVHNGSTEDFAEIMQSVVLDRPVVDQTALTGRWDFKLQWTPDNTQFKTMGVNIPKPSDALDAPPPLFTAMEEQIGLKLAAMKTSVPVLIIDRVDKPSQN